MTLPYETATSGEKAIAEIQRILSKFGCQSFGHMTDMENQKTLIQFRWRDKNVTLEASWRGYAAAWLKAHPFKFGKMRCSVNDYNAKAMAQAKISVCSILRDWVKGQTMAVECGIMSFGAAFMSHMLLPDGQRVIDRVESDILRLPGKDE